VIVGSWLEKKEWGMPWSLKILSIKIWATMEVMDGCWIAHKWAYLERLSTTTMMTDLFPDLGKPTMKSIEIYVWIVGGIGSGWNVLGALTVSPLFHW
jgi:hypothetical protein